MPIYILVVVIKLKTHDCVNSFLLLSIIVMSNFDTFTANEAIAMIEDMVASDGEDFQMNSAIVLLARIEEAEAVTDEDSDHDDTGT